MRASSSKSSQLASTRGVRRLLTRLILGDSERNEPGRGRLMLEGLEQRQLMAGDMDLLFTDGNNDISASSVANEQSNSLQATTQAEGESAPNLQQFAKDLTAAGVIFYGAHWCPACTSQSEAFADGANDLPFVEVTNPDRTLNATGVAEGIENFPTWDFPNGTRLEGVQTLATLSQTSGVPIPQSDQPSFDPIGDLT